MRAAVSVAAADGVSTSTPGFETFFGTSAAAPHAAAMAALLKEVAPRAESEFLVYNMLASAMDIESFAVDDTRAAG